MITVTPAAVGHPPHICATQLARHCFRPPSTWQMAGRRQLALLPVAITAFALQDPTAGGVAQAAPPAPRWHTLEFGANLGYMGDPCASPEIIKQAAADGVITRLRAMDPFPAGSEGTWTPATAPATGSGWIHKILSAHPSTSLLVSLSSYPYKLPADFAARYQSYLSDIDWQDILRGMPASFNYSEYLLGLAAYTNRAPLFAAEGASLEDYTTKLAQLRGNVSSVGLSDRVKYEIGKCVRTCVADCFHDPH